MRNFGYDELGLDARRVMGNRLEFLDAHDKATEWALQHGLITKETATGALRAIEAERKLQGQPASETTFRAAAEAALASAKPLHDNAFKVELAKRT